MILCQLRTSTSRTSLRSPTMGWNWS